MTDQELPNPRRFIDNRDGINAHRLLGEVLAAGPIRAGVGATLWWYRDGVWLPDGEAEVVRRCVRLLGPHFRPAYRNIVIDMLANDHEFITGDQPGEFINCRNGLLRWATGDLEDHDPEIPSTYQLAIDWNPAATCDLVDWWLTEVASPDVIPLLWEIIGVSILPDMPYHRAILLYGHGRNGKGTFLRLIKKMIGSAFISAVTLQSLGEDRFAGADLFGKVANIAGDLDARHIGRTDLFKMATGGDLIRADRKYGQPFTFENRATMLFSANELPGTGDYSDGFFDRWLVVPFIGQLRGREDPSIEDKMHLELEGVLVKAVQALRSVQSRGGFSVPAVVAEATAAYRDDADPVRAFASERLVFGPDYRERRSEVYSRFRGWIDENGMRPPSARKFYARLAQLDGITSVDHKAGELYVTGARLWSTADDVAPF